jgi:hypothetical protein
VAPHGLVGVIVPISVGGFEIGDDHTEAVEHHCGEVRLHLRADRGYIYGNVDIPGSFAK